MPNIDEELTLREATTSTTAETGKSGRLRVRVINPGWGSSGYYSSATLEAAGRSGVIPAGTHMYADHMTETEQVERPERSVLDLVAVTTSPGVWDKTLGALVAEAQVLPPYREAFTNEDFLAATGVSIHGSAVFSEGEAEGRSGPIVSEITRVKSVDFVTHAGRGGKVLEILESARSAVRETAPEPAPATLGNAAIEVVVDGKSLGQFVREALPGGLTANDLSSALRHAVDAEYERPGDDDGKGYVWTYVRDWTDTLVVFSQRGDGAPEHSLWARGYTVADSAVTLTGDATPVAIQTNYVSLNADGSVAGPLAGSTTSTSAESERAVLRVDAPAPTPTDGSPAADPVAALAEALRAPRRPEPPRQPAGSTTESRREGTTTMPDISEGRLRELEAAESARPALEAERDRLRTERDEAVRGRQIAENRDYAKEFAATRVREANRELPASVVDRIVRTATRTIPIVESGETAGRLDTVALGPVVDEARTAEESYLASLLEESGAGTVRGVGSTNGLGSERYSDDAVESELAGLFGREIKKG